MIDRLAGELAGYVRLSLDLRPGPALALRRMRSDDALRRGVAEALGAGALTFFGAGAVVLGVALGQVSVLNVALANGLAFAIMVTALGHISGGHFNPAITFGFWVTGRITSRMAGIYVLFQLAGAVVAALLLRGIFDDRFVDRSNLGAPSVGPNVGTWEAFLFEIIGTFFLVLVVFATAVDSRGAFKIVGGFAIGLTISLGVLVGGPISGAAFNPSRAFGAELVSGFWGNAWIYYIAPLVGAALAAGAYVALYLDRPIEVIGRPGTGVEEDGVERAER
jgi:MIP family channel proteins